MSFDLDAYLARIHLSQRPAADAGGLAELQHAHRLAIPFENLDIRLGRRIRIDSESVFSKLVTAKRGGYCFEQNRLFADALAALGLEARPLLARVWLGASDTPGLTHMLLLVTIDGQDWIADAGFGGCYIPPLPRIDGGAALGPDGAEYCVRVESDNWIVERRADGHNQGWQPQYSFTLATVAPIDLAMSSHWTATAPSTRFVDFVVVSVALPRGFASLSDRTYKRQVAGEENSAVIDDPRVYRLRLSMMFGIDLTADEVAALGLF